MLSNRMKATLKLAAIELDAEARALAGCDEPQFIDYLDAAADILDSMGYDMNDGNYDVLLDSAASYMADAEWRQNNE